MLVLSVVALLALLLPAVQSPTAPENNATPNKAVSVRSEWDAPAVRRRSGLIALPLSWVVTITLPASFRRTGP